MTYARDSAMTALILGFFASCWFGWAQERPPATWKLPLIGAAALSLLIAVIGGIYAWRHWSDGSALNAPGAMRQYGIIVGLEFAIAAVGAIGLLVWGHAEYLAPWICLEVGVHFWPMAPVLLNPGLVVLGGLLAIIALVALLASRSFGLEPSALAGAGAGLALLGFAARSLASLAGGSPP